MEKNLTTHTYLCKGTLWILKYIYYLNYGTEISKYMVLFHEKSFRNTMLNLLNNEHSKCAKCNSRIASQSKPFAHVKALTCSENNTTYSLIVQHLDPEKLSWKSIQRNRLLAICKRICCFLAEFQQHFNQTIFIIGEKKYIVRHLLVLRSSWHPNHWAKLDQWGLVG